MHGMHIGRGHVRTRWGWSHSRHHWLWGMSGRCRRDLYNSSDVVPGQGSTEGKRKRSCEIAPPVEPSPPRTRAAASVGGREGQGAVNAVVWQEAGQADCENSVSRCMATSSLGSRVSTTIIGIWIQTWGIPMAVASATFAYLKGLKSSLM